MANYDLSEFVKQQQTPREQEVVIKINDDHTYTFKKSAWSFLQLSTISEKYKDDSAKIGQEVIRTFLGEEALKFIEGTFTKNINGEVQTFDNVPEPARLRIFSIIVSEITGSSPDQGVDKKK